MFFKPVYFPKIPILTRKEINGKRHYHDPLGKVLAKGVYFPSVTTVTGDLSKAGIDNWRKYVGEAEANRVQNRALTNGNEMHLLCEHYLKNEMPNNIVPIRYKNPVSRQLFEQMKPELNNIQNIRAQEVRLYSMEMQLAGTVDCLAEFNGVLSVIDFKSARKKKQKSYLKGYFYQATCYALMIEELTKVKVDQIVILVSSEDGVVKPWIEDKEQFVKPLHELIMDHRYRKDVFK